MPCLKTSFGLWKVFELRNSNFASDLRSQQVLIEFFFHNIARTLEQQPRTNKEGPGVGGRGKRKPLPSPPFIPLIGSSPNFLYELRGEGEAPFLSAPLALALALSDNRKL